MKLATIRDGEGTLAVRIDGDEAVELAAADVGEVLDHDCGRLGGRRGRAPAAARRARLRAGRPEPDKIVCVGLNYRSHILEMGRELPEHPTLFAKYRSALDRRQRRHRPAGRVRAGRLGGRAGRRHRRPRPPRVGRRSGRVHRRLLVLNDVSVRDYQNRTLQWLQGKTFEATTPVGPWLVTADESPGPSREISVRSTASRCRRPTPPTSCSTRPRSCRTSRRSSPSSRATSSPPGHAGGVGAGPHAAALPRRGPTVVTRIAGIGELRNRCRKERLR